MKKCVLEKEREEKEKYIPPQFFVRVEKQNSVWIISLKSFKVPVRLLKLEILK